MSPLAIACRDTEGDEWVDLFAASIGLATWLRNYCDKVGAFCEAPPA